MINFTLFSRVFFSGAMYLSTFTGVKCHRKPTFIKIFQPGSKDQPKDAEHRIEFSINITRKCCS